MPHDPHENGRVASTEVDSYGDVVSNLSDVPEGLLPKVQGNQPGGLLCRPLDKDARCVYTADGDTCEVQALRSRRAIQALHKRAGEIPKGATRLHSMGNAPDMVQVRDSEILIGVGATAAAARVGDEVQAGTLQITAVAPVPPSPVGTLTITYTNGVGGAPQVLALTIPGLGAGTATFALKGKITKGSDLVKVK